MKKFTFKEKLGYSIDKLLSKGTGVLILILVVVTFVVVLLAGLAMMLFDPEYAGGAGASLWTTFMYTLDAGTLAGYTTTLMGIVLLSVTTICGIFITSMLIGILNTGLEAKLDELKKGTSKVIEQNHTVIIGFNENIFTLISELIEANENATKPVIVVLGSGDKSEMEADISDKISDRKNTSIIVRNGGSSDSAALGRCSIETAKSVIINENDDAEVIKSILAVTYIMNSDENCKAYITANINDEQNVAVAKIAGEGRAEIVFFKSAISRIMANTCHQPGLSKVYTELFDFAGDEIYMENHDALAGKTFGEIINLFEISTVMGLRKGDVPLLNPPMDTVVEKGDEIMLMASDDGVSIPTATAPAIETDKLSSEQARSTKVKERLLVLGYNELLPLIVNELDNYVEKGSEVKIACEEITEEQSLELTKTYENMSVTVDACEVCSSEVLTSLVTQQYEHIIVLSVPNVDIELSDAKTLMILLHLKNIAQQNKIKYSVISQMLSAANGELAKIANVNDFVVSTNLTSLMIAQISENRSLAPIFEDILDSDGSEIYMKPAKLYVKTEMPVSLYTASYAAMKKGEVMLGIKTVRTDEAGNEAIDIITNPKKSDSFTFSEKDLLIVVAEEG